MADAETRVVGHRDRRALLAEDLLQVARPLAETRLDDDVGAELQFRDVFREVVAGRFQRDGVDRNLLTLVLLRRAADDEHVDGFDDLAAAERGCGTAGDQLRLVGVVVEHLPDTVDVRLGERPRDALGDTVTDGVGVADPLPFDDLHFLVLDCPSVDFLDPDVPLAHWTGFGRPPAITCEKKSVPEDNYGLSPATHSASPSTIPR